MRDVTIHQARQDRSRETHERLLDAAEEVLETRSFAETSIAEIARRAGFTVGAFYGRFRGKDALLEALEERLRELYAVEVARLRILVEQGVSLEALLTALLEAVVRTFRDRRGLALTLTEAARSHPELRQRRERLNAGLAAELTELLLSRSEEIRHEYPQEALGVALLMAMATLRETVLNADFWPRGQGPEAEPLIREVRRALLAYLREPKPSEP